MKKYDTPEAHERILTTDTEKLLRNAPTGPLPRSLDGNNIILVVMDYFIKWPEAYPISNQEASTVAEECRSRDYRLFSIPDALHLPADLLFSKPPDAPLAPEEYVEKLQARMEEMYHLARD
ncbi:retrovirus-related Pol polyprotein from transposon 297 [Trichonephila clavipes]|nr:retrovirus-related Pol polyprotein from transposon 297 [Trichonephila clavipes]